ncbi:hypothetical protein C8R44DRAFT_746232 [Mycena epipterygia]|nr:hypothetical protein C8R44DRAFT_746232 [Mycena epipterygia]
MPGMAHKSRLRVNRVGVMYLDPRPFEYGAAWRTVTGVLIDDALVRHRFLIILFCVQDAVNAATRNSTGITTPVVLRTDQLDVHGGKLKISPDLWDMAANSLSSVARLVDPDRICIFCGKTQRRQTRHLSLFAPNVVEAAVRLTLTRDWDLWGDTVEWQARVHPDGTLMERTTGLDVAYLFWETLTDHDVPMTPPGSPLLNPVEPSVPQSELFSPTTCDLTPADSVLLPVNTIAPYLDEALRKLGLRTEPRTSFMTPPPAVVTHVFMIFKGVAELDIVAGEWKKAAGDPARWRLGARWILVSVSYRDGSRKLNPIENRGARCITLRSCTGTPAGVFEGSVDVSGAETHAGSAGLNGIVVIIRTAGVMS